MAPVVHNARFHKLGTGRYRVLCDGEIIGTVERKPDRTWHNSLPASREWSNHIGIDYRRPYNTRVEAVADLLLIHWGVVREGVDV